LWIFEHISQTSGWVTSHTICFSISTCLNTHCPSPL
jgi:hypothetical protein